MNNQEPDEETLRRWHNDPNNWKWGFIYVNPKDPRIVVLKRLGWTGITFNFAHVWSHIILAVLILTVFLSAVFS